MCGCASLFGCVHIFHMSFFIHFDLFYASVFAFLLLSFHAELHFRSNIHRFGQHLHAFLSIFFWIYLKTAERELGNFSKRCMWCVMILSGLYTYKHTQMEQQRSKTKTRIRQLFNLKPLISLCLLGHNRLSRVVRQQRSHNRLVKPNLLQLREHGMAKMGIKRITQKKIISIIFYVRQQQSTEKMHHEEINALWWWWGFGATGGRRNFDVA